MGQPIRVSQALSLVMAAVAAVMLFYQIRVKKCSAEDLLVNRLARQRAEEAADAEPASKAPEETREIPEEPENPQTEEDEPHGGEN